ncbi:MAG: L,D-transpeptidase family protein [Anaerolineaceae bacterium]|nr:L,D-transpeptidase family protein [Anaerolineaceae bacterium]
MKNSAISLEQIMAEAKHALQAGDKATAELLAQQAYQMAPENVDALLLKASTSDAQSGLQYLNQALAIDPGNPAAREAMAITAAHVRSSASASWKPEETSEVRVNPVAAAKPQRKPSFVLPLAILLAALLFVFLVKAGVFNAGPANKLFGLLNLGNQASLRHHAALEASLNPTQVFGTASAMLKVTAEPSAEALQQSGTSGSSLGASTPDNAKTETGQPSLTTGPQAAASPELATQVVFVPLVGSSAASTAVITPLSPVLSTPAPEMLAVTPVAAQSQNVPSDIPVIQITPIQDGQATPGKITSVIVTAESGEGSLVPIIGQESGSSGEIPIIPITEVPAEEAAQYIFYEAPVPPQPVVSYGEKWIDIDLTNQMLYAYSGDTLLNSFLVSTGMPATPTVTGTFRIYVKYLYANMRGDDYDLPNVPYTMYFHEGYGIHGTYWHHNFGVPMSHGCVNMETSQAGWIYEWAPVGTIVNVHY